MASEFEVTLEGGAPWGFRLQGGKEFRIPLRVAKVEYNGKAYKGGMEVGDHVTSINGVSTSDVFHTEALAVVKKANNTLTMGLQRSTSEGATEISRGKVDLNRNEPNRNYINGRTSGPAPPQAAPTSPVRAKPQVWAPPGDHYGQSNGYPSRTEEVQVADVQYNEFYAPRHAQTVSVGSWDDEDHRTREERSSDIINAAVRTPAPINLVDPVHRDSRIHSETAAIATDMEQKDVIKAVPKAPESLRGFEKPKIRGRGKRRLTNSGSYEDSDSLNSSSDQRDSVDFSPMSPLSPQSPSDWNGRLSNQDSGIQSPTSPEATQNERLPVFRLLHAKRDPNRELNEKIKLAAAERSPSPPPDHKSSTLPRKLGQRKEPERASMSDYDDRAKTLPGKKSAANTVPAWYKQMYKEMHNSMEGESHLTRLLTSDAARGAFRKYDGATSPNTLRSQSPTERQRPVSMHLRASSDDNVFSSNSSEPAGAKVSVRGLKSTYMEKMSTDGQPPKLSRQEERQKRHSVHSTWYRQIQKGGEIPMTGLRTQDNAVNAPTLRQFSKEEGDKPDKQPLAQGRTYQRLEKSLVTDEEKKKRFEYNNPPDFLELRKRAEAEGRLQEDRDRERRLIEEERERRQRETKERKQSYEVERDRQRQLEEERQQRLAEDRQRRLEAERKHQEVERRRAEEKRRLEEEKYRQEQERFRREQERAEEERRREQERKRLELERLKKEEAKRQAELEKQKTMNGDVGAGHAKALYSFHPQSSSELAFKKGEIVKIVRQIDDNWYEGEHRGNIGIFPVSYVEMLKPTAPPALQVEEGLAKAKYSFKAESPKELSFKKAEMVTLLRKIDANWYEGEIGDKIGIFPSSYIEVVREPKILGKVEVNSPKTVVEDTIDGPIQNHIVESAPPEIETNGPSETQGEKYRVIFGYTPLNEDEVSLREGDIVNVVEKCDDGWYVGSVEGTSMFGIFPGNYVVRV